MRKTKLTLLLLAALLVGVCIGFYGNNAIIQARIRHFSQIPGNMPEHITQKLTQRLDLDAGQRAQVFAIVQSFDGRLQEARDIADHGLRQRRRTRGHPGGRYALLPRPGAQYLGCGHCQSERHQARRHAPAGADDPVAVTRGMV